MTKTIQLLLRPRRTQRCGTRGLPTFPCPPTHRGYLALTWPSSTISMMRNVKVSKGLYTLIPSVCVAGERMYQYRDDEASASNDIRALRGKETWTRAMKNFKPGKAEILILG